MLTTYEDFYPTLLPHLPGAPQTAVDVALTETARTFYKRTQAWQESLGPLDLTEGDERVWINPFDDLREACYILGAWFDGNPVAIYPAQPPAGVAGPTTGVFMETADLLRVSPIPDQDYTDKLTVLCAVRPRIGKRVLPDEALQAHFEALRAGTLANMKAHPSKPYSDPKGAAAEQIRFTTEMHRAKNVSERGYVRAPHRWRYPVVPIR